MQDGEDIEVQINATMLIQAEKIRNFPYKLGDLFFDNVEKMHVTTAIPHDKVSKFLMTSSYISAVASCFDDTKTRDQAAHSFATLVGLGFAKTGGPEKVFEAHMGME